MTIEYQRELTLAHVSEFEWNLKGEFVYIEITDRPSDLIKPKIYQAIKLEKENDAILLYAAGLIYVTAAGRRGFVGIEVKYSESCQEPVPTLRPRYDELAQSVDLFVDPMDQALRTNSVQQLFRQHLLAAAMRLRGDFDETRFILIAPRLNRLVADAAAACQAKLKPAHPSGVGFASISLEDTIAALAVAGEEEYAARLYRRYADFWLVDGELNLFWAGDGPIGKNPAATTAAGPLKLLPGGRA